jgi:hypothetical protein
LGWLDYLSTKVSDESLWACKMTTALLALISNKNLFVSNSKKGLSLLCARVKDIM